MRILYLILGLTFSLSFLNVKGQNIQHIKWVWQEWNISVHNYWDIFLILELPNINFSSLTAPHLSPCVPGNSITAKCEVHITTLQSLTNCGDWRFTPYNGKSDFVWYLFILPCYSFFRSNFILDHVCVYKLFEAKVSLILSNRLKNLILINGKHLQ